jgi:hypothetical protein
MLIKPGRPIQNVANSLVHKSIHNNKYQMYGLFFSCTAWNSKLEKYRTIVVRFQEAHVKRYIHDVLYD